jgi:hypothetical protein
VNGKQTAFSVVSLLRIIMDRAKFGHLLTLASQQLAEANHSIAKQKKILSDLIKEGGDTAQARALLEKLNSSAEAMAEHERAIQAQIREFELDEG